MGVFHNQYATILDMRNALVSGYYLLVVAVATVVQNHVNIAHLREEFIPKMRISLVPNVDLKAIFFIKLCGRIQVNTDHSCAWSKVFAPHEKRSAIQDANFDKYERLIPVFLQAFFVNLKIRAMPDRAVGRLLITLVYPEFSYRDYRISTP